MRKLSNVWLLAVACLFYLVPITSNFYAVTAWVAPIVLLMYFYKEKAKRAAPLALGSLSIVMAIAYYGVMPGGLGLVLVTMLVSVAMLIVLLLVNKWVVDRIGHVASVVFFPLLMTGYEYFSSYGSAFGTFNSSAYSQLDIRPIAMLASVSGIWGIVFIQYLVVSALAYAFKSGFRHGFRHHRRLWISTLTVVSLLVGAGAILSSGVEEPSRTVKASGITPDRVLWDDTVLSLIERWGTPGFYDGLTRGPAGLEQIRQLNESMLGRTKEELERGSRLIGWSEGAAIVMEHEEGEFRQRLQSLSGEFEAVLIAGYLKVNAQDGQKMDNKLVVVDVDGTIKADYSKYSLVAGEERYFNKGEEVVPVVETALGTIAVAICFDADFPHRIREAGIGNPNILILPSSDWKAISPYHTEISAFRAIENHMSVLRVTHAGMSAAYDAKGRQVGQMNDWDNEHGTVISVELPLPGGKHTPYKTLGDLLPILAGAAALMILAVLVVRVIIGRMLLGLKK
ncbi:nitrilase-related carbon-nitrogen hydrolase [Paenibacillus sp. PL2-23]|uniref:nitrilase-related carbon-nitrogen hydrolase n=1 Tax=Paenibacillus sp. PL2-23 TaxID=2100729 RepID=UPI0030FB261D